MRKPTLSWGLLFALLAASSAGADLAPSDPDSVLHIAYECRDGVDNDGDGLADFPDDPDCVDADDEAERMPTPVARPWRVFRPLRTPSLEGAAGVSVWDVSHDGRVKTGSLSALRSDGGRASVASLVWYGRRPRIIEDLRPIPEDATWEDVIPATGAYGVSADGRWVTGSHGLYPSMRAYRWRNGEFTDLEQPNAPGTDRPLDTYGAAVSNHGVVVGRGDSEPVRWDEQGFASLHPGPTRGFALARAITPDSAVTVGSAFFDVEGRLVSGASRWEGSDLRPIPLDVFFIRAVASDVSDDGSTIVGAVEGFDQIFRVWGFIATEAGVTYVQGPDLPSHGPPSTSPFRVSGDGSLVAGWLQGFGPVLVAGGKVRSLADLLENEYGVDLSGWSLTPHGDFGLGLALSGDGRTLVLDARFEDGPYVPVEVRLPPACSDGLDNDGDGAVDTDDGGCRHARDRSEDSSAFERRVRRRSPRFWSFGR